MTTLSHDGYIAEVTLDEDSGRLSGLVLNTRATLHFAGRTIEELKAAFAETIEGAGRRARSRKSRTPARCRSGYRRTCTAASRARRRRRRSRSMR